MPLRTNATYSVKIQGTTDAPEDYSVTGFNGLNFSLCICVCVCVCVVCIFVCAVMDSRDFAISSSVILSTI
jgi:hypothetical protein